MAKIYIERPSEFFNRRNAYQIYIDDKKVGTIGNSQNQYFEVEQGEHTVVAKVSSLGFLGSPNVSVTVKGNEVKSLKVSGMSGAMWVLGVGAAAFGISYAVEPSHIDQHSYIIIPGIFLLYFLTFGRKKQLSLTIEEYSTN